ncbi:MAG: hypothetical protein HYT83_03860 [Candidatus Levybacteria bacterium]|nr:hypothetical protein [Candidatus Levybacteria bacterium]
MICSITTKGCRLSDVILEHINQHAQKIAQFLSGYGSDLPLLVIILRKHKRRLGQNTEIITFDEGDVRHIINNKTASTIYFDGTITLRIPKKPLVVHLTGGSPDEAVNIGFERLIKELKTYKGKHFSSNSEYFDHRSIRKV